MVNVCPVIKEFHIPCPFPLEALAINEASSPMVILVAESTGDKGLLVK